MVFKTWGKELRALFFQCLRLPDSTNQFYSAEQNADICNLAAGLELEPESGIAKSTVGRAFSNDSRTEWVEEFAMVTLDPSVTGDLYDYISHRFVRQGSFYTGVGLFTVGPTQREEARQRFVSGENRCSFRNWDFSAIDEQYKTAFRSVYSTKEKRTASSSKK